MQLNDWDYVRAKINRAYEQLRILSREVTSYVDRCEHNAKFIVDDERQRILLSYAVDREPDVRLSLLTGEIVHNTRTALDNLVCALARTSNPKDSCKGRGYPCFTVATEYACKRSDILRGVPDSAKDLIDGLQPCTRLDGSSSSHPVALLCKLSNRDEHRALHLTTVASRNTQFAVQDAFGTWQVLSLGKALYQGRYGQIPLPTFPIRISSSVRVAGRSSVMFTDSSLGLRERELVDVLTDCVDFVSLYVLPKFASWFHP